MNEFEGSPKTWPPLGMPTGSVRALLTLILVAVVIVRIARGDDFTENSQLQDPIWIEALLIALSHYFTSRRFVDLPPEALRRLEDEGIVERERQPLFLPKNTIRLAIVAAFGWLAYYLHTQDRLIHGNSGALLALLGAFLLGAVFRRIGGFFRRGNPSRSSGTLGDLKALVVLIAMLIVAVPEFLGAHNALDPMVHRIALALMLFYFGSR